MWSCCRDGNNFPEILNALSLKNITINLTNLRVSFQLHLVTESPVSKLDQVATNGVVQVLDKVMYPPQKTLQGTLKEKQFSTFFGMIEQTDVIAYLISSMFVI